MNNPSNDAARPACYITEELLADMDNQQRGTATVIAADRPRRGDNWVALYTAPPSLDTDDAALREDAECYRWLLPRLRVESDNGPELSRWESMVYLVGGSAWVPGSPSYTTVTQAINAARAAEGKGS